MSAGREGRQGVLEACQCLSLLPLLQDGPVPQAGSLPAWLFRNSYFFLIDGLQQHWGRGLYSSSPGRCCSLPNFGKGQHFGLNSSSLILLENILLLGRTTIYSFSVSGIEN